MLQTNKSSLFGDVRRGSLVDVASVGDEAGCPRSQALLGADVLGSRRGVAGIPSGHHMHRKSDLDDAVENPSPSPVVQPNDEDPAEWLDAKLLATEQYAEVEESYLETSIPGTTADGASVLDKPLDRRSLHEIIATTNSSAEAWDAYEMLLSLPRDGAGAGLPIPFRYMHRLAHLLVATKPRTRALFLRLLSVLSHLHQWGGRVRLWQWNALIDCAGKGWRKTRVEDFKSALDVYHDMISRSAPGSAFSENEFAQSSDGQSAVGEFAEPDIFTYTTLVNIAGRTLNQATLRHATTMLNASGLSPNRITHLSLIRYFTRARQLSGVRATLSKMKEQGFEIGLDGFNACIWAYGRNGRLEVASTIYRVLRHNLLPETNTGEDDINAAIEYLYASEDITIPETLTPNAVTGLYAIDFRAQRYPHPT
ncbi:hypothetical protein A0H81_04026 [Grifola frondosa]|uniref:Pentatricopeptide repeat protein n=1 Tax=Grifola frondosa TaxID=5627 RepID=A0A1C7MHY7_GRIFR|nr:hypothetical protein A0H81_04026 [Grifola frondosa]